MSRKPLTALLLVNPKARQGKADIKAALAAIEANNITLLEPEKRSRDLSKTIRAYAKKVDLVIIGGGDGTLNNALPGLLETELPLGILPLGTGNDLARTMALPLDIEAAAKVIGVGKPHVIDVGDVNGHPFFNVASIGFGADLASNLSPELKKRWGPAGYIFGTLQLVSQQRPFRVELDDGTGIVRPRTFHVAVGNGSYYGGGMRVDTRARPDDGKLHVYSLECTHWLGLLPLAPFLKFGWHTRFRSVRTFETQKLTLKTHKPRAINVDGELVTQTPATFTVKRKAVRIYAP